ncbi:metallophosphoesterase family protein [Mucilaginibacter sp. X5P1]|uniref:metallophosphoesterase family protein n=1 Tax=Mucilaginibacter sp. X5P1 TaxID=2723088 RepID=UPI0016226A61|nr:metallophosphoesterase [Mucilaginibacter sp. X5P1]MBB6139873.1 putative phosphodiesterase [Mucilaginibacter sp. X5P1]
MDRKEFIAKSGLAGGVLLFARYPELQPKDKKIRIGVIADLHHDIMYDGLDRLSAFIDEMNTETPDFIIQMGDLCFPKKENLPLMDVWNKFKGPKYHVIGNHDTDGGYTRDQVVEFWNAKGKYYSFDANGFHFVVLDGNENNPSPYRPMGYARYISPEQLEWLKSDLDATILPTIIFCHQGLDNDAGGLENGTLLRYTLEQANQKSGQQKVILVLTGHHHQDYYNRINDIHYVQINSASYQWLGDKYKEIRYSPEVDKARPNIKYTVPYKDPLWAMIEIGHNGTINIKGKKTVFVGSSPEKLGVNLVDYIYPIVPYISDRKIKMEHAIL